MLSHASFLMWEESRGLRKRCSATRQVAARRVVKGLRAKMKGCCESDGSKASSEKPVVDTEFKSS